jgi:hypothetical protein
MDSGYFIEDIQDQIIDPIRNHPESKEVPIPKIRNLIGPQWNTHLFVPWRGYVFSSPSVREKDIENETSSFDQTESNPDLDWTPGRSSEYDESSTDDSQDWGDLLGSEFDDSSINEDDNFMSSSSSSEELEQDPFSWDDENF